MNPVNQNASDKDLLIPSTSSCPVFVCTACSQSFPDGQILKNHMKHHVKMENSSKEENSNNVCLPSTIASQYNDKESIFDAKVKILNETMHKDTEKLSCIKCKQSFKNMAQLTLHLRKCCPNALPFECEECLKRFMVIKGLISHQKYGHREKTKKCKKICENCQKTFQKNKYLLFHLRSCCPSLIPFHCNICFKQFMCERNMKNHEKSHNKSASSLFDNKTTCKTSKETSYSEKQAESTCDFTQQSDDQDVKDITQIFKVCSKITCEKCHKKFTRKIKLQKHLRVCCPSFLPFTCEICSKRFLCPKSVTTHKETHIKSFDKSICGTSKETESTIETKKVFQNNSTSSFESEQHSRSWYSSQDAFLFDSPIIKCQPH